MFTADIADGEVYTSAFGHLNGQCCSVHCCGLLLHASWVSHQRCQQPLSPLYSVLICGVGLGVAGSAPVAEKSGEPFLLDSIRCGHIEQGYDLFARFSFCDVELSNRLGDFASLATSERNENHHTTFQRLACDMMVVPVYQLMAAKAEDLEFSPIQHLQVRTIAPILEQTCILNLKSRVCLSAGSFAALTWPTDRTSKMWRLVFCTAKTICSSSVGSRTRPEHQDTAQVRKSFRNIVKELMPTM